VKLRITLLGCFVLLAMIAAGAFLLSPLHTTSAAPAHKQTVVTTYHNLEAQQLPADKPVTIYTKDFVTNHPGVLSIRTTQNADLGMSGKRDYNKANTLGVVVVLDDTVIYATKFNAQSHDDSTVKIGIFTTQHVNPGRHNITIEYVSFYNGRSASCDSHSYGKCPGTSVERGRVELVVPYTFDRD